MPQRPLEGLRVIDCSTVVAGPRIGMYMGDFGADVIKIEHPTRGDDTRRFGASKEGVSMYWKLVSRNKRHVTLDPKDAISHASCLPPPTSSSRISVPGRWNAGASHQSRSSRTTRGSSSSA